MLALHRASWLRQQRFTCSVPPALGDMPRPSCQCCVAEEGVPIALGVPHPGMGVPPWSWCVQARPQQSSPVSRPSPIGRALPRGDRHKKCKEIVLGPPRRQVISAGATWLDLTSPGFVLCMGTYLPSPPQTTSAKECWAGATVWRHEPCLSRHQNAHPPSVMGEERATVPETKDAMEGGSPAGISPTARGQGSLGSARVQGGQGEGG